MIAVFLNFFNIVLSQNRRRTPHWLKLRSNQQKTKKKSKYKWIPLIKTVSLAQKRIGFTQKSEIEDDNPRKSGEKWKGGLKFEDVSNGGTNWERKGRWWGRKGGIESDGKKFGWIKRGKLDWDCLVINAAKACWNVEGGEEFYVYHRWVVWLDHTIWNVWYLIHR